MTGGRGQEILFYQLADVSGDRKKTSEFSKIFLVFYRIFSTTSSRLNINLHFFWFFFFN